jgi:hypothetical protein
LLLGISCDDGRVVGLGVAMHCQTNP